MCGFRNDSLCYVLLCCVMQCIILLLLYVDFHRKRNQAATASKRLKTSYTKKYGFSILFWKVFRIGTVCYNWPMSAHVSQAFSIAHCTDSEDLPLFCLFACIRLTQGVSISISFQLTVQLLSVLTVKFPVNLLVTY